MGTMLNGSLTVSDYDLISSGSVPSFSARLTEQSIHVDATESYTAYLLYFPTVSDESNANSMQLSEVQFTGIAIPEPTSILLLGIGCLGFGFGRSRR
ncbi:MAG: PEP-CTERM sorting domain-containing protein [Akkermansiaceae bacterium]|nr:PEP-CTERM sorting domain-containing protein [Akkermansiaceae bacterium]